VEIVKGEGLSSCPIFMVPQEAESMSSRHGYLEPITHRASPLHVASILTIILALESTNTELPRYRSTTTSNRRQKMDSACSFLFGGMHVLAYMHPHCVSTCMTGKFPIHLISAPLYTYATLWTAPKLEGDMLPCTSATVRVRSSTVRPSAVYGVSPRTYSRAHA
jgi:hypothetical protein